MRIQRCKTGGAAIRIRVAAVAIACLTTTGVGCAKSASEAGGNSEAARIPLDTAAVGALRDQWRVMDSALRTPDTSAKERDSREFVRLMKDLRVATAQEALARLGYGVAVSGELDPSTRRALAEFGSRHGLPESDSLTPALVVALAYADNHAFTPFGLRELSVSTGTWLATKNAGVHAQGTWSPADPPRQTSNIWCYRDLHVCREAVAYVLLGQLYTDVIEYDIDGWDAEELTAHSASICMSDKLTINRSQQSAVLVRSARGAGLAICDDTRPANKESVARLVSGRAVAESLATDGMRFFRFGQKAAELMRRLRELSKAKP